MAIDRDGAHALLREFVVPNEDLARFLNAGAPHWLGLLWTHVVMALSGDSIEYLDGRSARDGARWSAQMEIFTHGGRLIRAFGGQNANGDDTADVVVVPRSLLTSAKFDGGIGLFAPLHLEWPGEVTCTAEYPGFTLTLPMPERVSQEHWARYHTFLPSLLGDLRQV